MILCSAMIVYTLADLLMCDILRGAGGGAEGGSRRRESVIGNLFERREGQTRKGQGRQEMT